MRVFSARGDSDVLGFCPEAMFFAGGIDCRGLVFVLTVAVTSAYGQLKDL